MAVERLVLIGLSGTGKSTLAHLVAAHLGWEAIDTDAEIAVAVGMTVPEIFRQQGEAAFRRLERSVLTSALLRSQGVIATGAGAVLDPELWKESGLRRPGTLVVALDAKPETSLARLRTQQEAAGSEAERPLLAGDDPLARLVAMKDQRQQHYDQADITLIVDNVSLEVVASEITDLASESFQTRMPPILLETGRSSSKIYVRNGLLDQSGPMARQQWPRSRRAWLVSDEVVGPLYRETVRLGLEVVGFQVEVRDVPPGEGSKSVEGLSHIYDWVLAGGIERTDLMVALGGGVVGDLAGFAAATSLRGIALMHIPTSLVAMVDSSVGGKTGINHAAGKNLIGAFYQPPLVLVDPSLLHSLPPRQLTSGWAEVIKHAVIQGATPGGERADLFPFMQRNAEALRQLREPAISYLIRRNIAVKAAVVAADEREHGQRAFLNFGHTIGHAIEGAGYTYLHGEAVAIGMRAAMMISADIGASGPDEVAKVAQLLDTFSLPRQAAVDRNEVLALLGSDKKRREGKQRWVVPVRGGGVELQDDVPLEAVRAAIDAVIRNSGPGN